MKNFAFSFRSRVAALALASLVMAATAAAQLVPASYTGLAGPVSQVAIASSNTQQVVTAVINQNSDLELIAWNDTGSNATVPAITAFAHWSGTEAMSYVAIARGPQAGMVVTAALDTGGGLHLAVWQVGTSSFTQLYSNNNTGISGTVVALDWLYGTNAYYGTNYFVTATALEGTGNLQVNAWQISDPNLITPYAQASAGAVSAVTLKQVNQGPGPLQIATAVVNSAANLEVIQWSINNNKTISRLGSQVAGEISPAPRINGYSDGYQSSIGLTYGGPIYNPSGFTTCVINIGNDLEVIGWVLNAGVFERVYTGTAGSASMVACDFGMGPYQSLTAVLDSVGNLSVEGWSYSGTGGTLSDAGNTYNTTTAISTYSPPAVTSDLYGGPSCYTASMSSGNGISNYGNLEIMVWNTKLQQ